MPGNGRKKMDCGVNTTKGSERKRKTQTKREKPLGTKGALLYMVCDHVVRPGGSDHPGIRMSGLFCVTGVPYKGLHPLRRFAAILAKLGNKHGSDEPYLFPISFIKTTIRGG